MYTQINIWIKSSKNQCEICHLARLVWARAWYVLFIELICIFDYSFISNTVGDGKIKQIWQNMCECGISVCMGISFNWLNQLIIPMISNELVLRFCLAQTRIFFYRLLEYFFLSQFIRNWLVKFIVHEIASGYGWNFMHDFIGNFKAALYMEKYGVWPNIKWRKIKNK